MELSKSIRCVFELCFVDFNADQTIMGNFSVFTEQRKSLNTHLCIMKVFCDRNKFDSVMHPPKWSDFHIYFRFNQAKFFFWQLFTHQKFQLPATQTKKENYVKINYTKTQIHTHTHTHYNREHKPKKKINANLTRMCKTQNNSSKSMQIQRTIQRIWCYSSV